VTILDLAGFVEERGEGAGDGLEGRRLCGADAR
jgi:hypothetical protein